MKFTKITNSSKEGTLKPYWPGWLQERFPDHFAQIGTVNTLKLKNAVRDVARAILGSVPPDIERLAKGFLMPPQGVTDKNFIFGYQTDSGFVPGSIEIDKNLQEYIRRYPEQWKIVQESLALWRSKGRHAAGYVISNEPIDEFIPTTRVSGVKVLDFSGPEVEAVGGIKMDFLVVNSIRDLQEAVRLVQKDFFKEPPKDQIIDNILVPSNRIIPTKQGIADIWNLPQDKEVFEDIDKGNVETVFQFCTDSAKKWLKYFVGIINSIHDMAVFTALDRPGPLDAVITASDGTSVNMLVEYARRARGLEGSKDIVKQFDELCKETKGVMIFQETLMRVYQYFTDCTLAEAEEFRGNVGKKKKEKIEKAYTLFMERAEKKVSKEEAQAVWDAMITFAAYGFNCLDGEEKVCTNYSSAVAIKDLKEGDRVLSVNGCGLFEYLPCDVWKTGEKEVLEVTLEFGRTVKATEDHQFLYKTQWLTLKELIAIGEMDRYGNISKIINVKSLGIRPVYDLEVKGTHNFILSSGVVAHNCSHAVSYATISYTCLYLKHYYPLHWWTAVLRNATKEEINDKFWIHIGDRVLLPDVTVSKSNWEIEGSKIRAPISLLYGMGETAHKQLMIGAPYSDLKSFCQSIVDYQKANTITKDKVDKDGKVSKVATWGRNALDIGKIYSMLYAGSLDSLFDKDLTISEKVDAYHNMMKELYLAEGKKYVKPKKELPKLDAIGRYQAKKDVLPPYGEDLRPILIRDKLLPSMETDGTNIRIKSKIWSKQQGCELDTFDPVVGAVDIKNVELSEDFVAKFYRFGIIVYVESKETIHYGEGKNKTAIKFFVEVGGRKMQLVQWPSFDDDKLPSEAVNLETGSIAAMVLQKNSGKTDFTIRHVELIRKPLDSKKEDSDAVQET